MRNLIVLIILATTCFQALANDDAWAKPSELWGKKLIGTGQYSLDSVTPRFLADHPEFAARHPFDGIVVLAPLDPAWCAANGSPGYNLDSIAWTTCPVPYEAVQGTIADLNRVSWASLTDNFLSYRLVYHMEDENHRLDLTNDADWAIAEQNAALSARVCREAKLKGFWLDTEQYNSYPDGKGHYPMGKDTPEILRKRGAQWIKAVQAEFPEITIIVTFPWSNDLEEASFLFGVKDFLNGVLEGIQPPAHIIHGYENTFYYGAAAGSQYTADGFPGDRARYEGTRDAIKKWRSYSTDPGKYDSIVKVGMAAWVESDPWNLWSGWPSGVPQNWWSNAPLALAYSDEYVWCWSEHTHYGHTMDVVNPFLASLTNQTFNTGEEAVESLDEDFTTDPLLHGWYFDFDMLDIGRNPDGKLQFPAPTLDAVPYAWSIEDKAVNVLGAWMTGPKGNQPAKMGLQRRRYVHPIQSLRAPDNFQMSLDFTVGAFGEDSDNPIVLGLFNSDSLANRQSLSLVIRGPKDAAVMLSGNQNTASTALELSGELVLNTCYHLTFIYNGDTRRLSAKLTEKEKTAVIAEVDIPVDDALGDFALNEAGVAQWDANPTNTSMEKAYKYRLQHLSLEREPERWAKPAELRGKKLIGTGQYSIQDWPPQITPAFLAAHPDFTATHPFDGLTMVAPLDPAWLASQGVEGPGLKELLWSRVPVPYTAAAKTLEDLNRIVWGSLTDNFLYCSLNRAQVAITSPCDKALLEARLDDDADWAVVEQNVKLLARICREAGLKGFMLDTEQYEFNPDTEIAYPFGAYPDDLLRRRGEQWIQAVQSELPGIVIIIFFSWSPELDNTGFLKGVRPFLDGVLEGIHEPAILVNAHENTFYYGHAPGTKHAPAGYPGDRARYQQARNDIKSGRLLSVNPDKYDRFVQTGMAAWLESDPWDLLSPESLSGKKSSFWSNVPLALAYSDQYIWVWSELTQYGQSHLRDIHHLEPSGDAATPPSEWYAKGYTPNMYLASLRNQTFNTGVEAVETLEESFAANPLHNGWYFDFDMLDVGRRMDAAQEVPILSADAVPYIWSPDDQSVRVLGAWMTGPKGDQPARMGLQRRRYAHPIKPLTHEMSFKVELEFEIERFGEDPANPIVMGMFNSGELINRHAITLHINGPEYAYVTAVGDGESWPPRLPIAGGLKTGNPYRAVFASHHDGWFRFTLTDLATSSVIALREVTMPDHINTYTLDEIGAAQYDAGVTCTSPEKAYSWKLRRVSLERGGNYQMPPRGEAWAKPGELRGKKMISSGLFILAPWEPQITPGFLARNPEFIENHPFDGIMTTIPLDPGWSRGKGVENIDLGWMLWSETPVPDSAVAESLHYLQQTDWRHLTDNFIYCPLLRAHLDDPSLDPEGKLQADFEDDAGWAVVEHNAALMARICREARFKGVMLDTEQYNSDPASGKPYPLGMYSPEVLRKRGSQWIQALQREYPEITIIIFFSWYFDEFNYTFDGAGALMDSSAGFLHGVRYFLDGVLEGIQEPGRLVNAHENTFYFGLKPHTQYTATGISGDRMKYQWARDAIRSGRLMSSNPDKYDCFVQTGMAAWVESDPWNLAPGWPAGCVSNFWSNLPLALAYSDEYVWVWSEHTHYGLTMNQLNPFLASLSNQTFNTGNEATREIHDDFSTDPLQRGWYFDFDMLNNGRKADPDHPTAAMSLDTVPYVWSPEDHSVKMQGAWPEAVPCPADTQRRRYVHPIAPLTHEMSFQAEFDFTVDDFGDDPANPIILGLFNSDEKVNRQSIILQISAPNSVEVVLAGDGMRWMAPLWIDGGLLTETRYHVVFSYDAGTRILHAILSVHGNAVPLADVTTSAPVSAGGFSLDEIGLAQWDVGPACISIEKAYRYRLHNVMARR